MSNLLANYHMNNKQYHVAPLIQKMLISLVVLENSVLESMAFRGVLESFG